MQLVFSDKELYLHLKQFMDTDPINQGREERDRVIELWDQGDMKAFVTELERLSQDQSLWRVKQIDLVYWYKVLNAIDTLLYTCLCTIKGESNQVNISERQNLEADLQKVIKFLKSLVQYASSSIHFNLTPYMIELYYLYSSNSLIKEDILTILICITSKIADKKWQHYNKKIEDLQNEVRKIMPSVMIMIKSFFMVSQFLLKEEVQPSLQKERAIQLGDRIIEFINFKFNKRPTETQTRERIEMEYCDYQQKIKNCENVRLFYEEQFILILKSINLYLNTGNLSEGKQKPGRQQTRKLEKMLPPPETVASFFQFTKDPRTQKKLQTQVINTFFLFIILDLNQIFDYVDPTQNKFYLQACKNPEFFIQLLQNLAKHHSYDKIQLYTLDPLFKDNQKELEEQLSISRSLLITQQENEDGIMLIDEDSSLFQQSEGIKSQKFMNAFLNFLCQLINIKNKQFQTQLHSQFLKPILAILSVKLINRVYPININVQVKAAKLLKDVIRHANLDEANSVEKVIERIKVEINSIYENETKVCQNQCNGMGYHEWEKALDDDTDNNMLFIYKQDFIRACLRFLCYSVFRNDPNQINFNQNFIANSRKILDSGIIQNEIMNLVIRPDFNANVYMHKIIDPIFLSCIQLISYVFNDLPQKIPQYLENGLLSSIIEALEVKIPIGPEVFSLIMKFLYTICLNPEGAKLVNNSKVINTLMMLACESQSYSHLSQNLQKQITYQQQLQQLALISQDISNKIYKALIDNFTILNKKAWGVTEYYVQVDKEVSNIDKQMDPEQAKVKKQLMRQAYEKKQTQLELCYENVTNLLFNFIYAENEQFGDDNMIHRVIKQNPDYCTILLEVIATPIVASACPNMFRHFIYFLSTILNEFDQPFKLDYLSKILSFLKQQIKNLHLLLQVSDLDSLQDIDQNMPSNHQVVLGELCTEQDKKDLLLQLRGEDQISVCFGKISFYCDIFRSAMSNFDKSLKIIQFEDYTPIMNDLFKVQALINRYHSSIYFKDLNKQYERYLELCQKYPDEVASLSLTQKKEDRKAHWNIQNEKDELAKLHYQFVTDTVASLSVVEARISHRTVIELSLEDNISHTSNMCQIAIRKLIVQNMKVLNKQKVHFSQAIEEKVLLINQTMGKAIADGFKECLDLSEVSDIRADANYIMKICCQHSAVFGEFNKVLFPNQISSGYLLIGFIENKGLEYIAHLVKWVIESIRQIELKCHGRQNIRVDLCKHIQLLWSHVIDFYSQFIEGKYLDSQFQQFLIAFKSNPTEKLKKDDPKKEYDTAVQTMQKYMYSQYVSVCHFLFYDLDKEQGIQQLGFNVFQYFDKYSELFFSTFMDIYQIMCNGFLQCKFFDISTKHITEANSPDKQSDDLLERMLQMKERLNEFAEDVKKEGDIQSQSNKSNASPEKNASQEHESQLSPVTLPGTIYTQDELIQILQHTLPTILQFKPTNPKLVQKIKIIESIIFKLGIQKENQKVQDFLLFFKNTMFTLLAEAVSKGQAQDIGTLSHAFECLLRFKRGTLFEGDDIYKHLNMVNEGFRLLIADLQKHISVSTDKIEDMAYARMELSELISQVNICLSLFLNIAEEIKTISDIKKLDSILTAGSSLADPIQGISEDLREVQNQNTRNIFINEVEKAGHLLSKITLSLIELFQSLHHINIDFEPDKDYLIYTSIYHSICLLNFLVNIKDQGDFDCHQLLLKNNGLGALFEIKCIQKNFEFQRSPLERKLQSKIDNINVQSKILLQQLCSNDQTQIRIYESLIKSILFINFQERYKREEGQDVKKILINEEMKQQIKQQQSSKKKKLQTPMKRSKSEDRQQELADSNSKQNQEPSNRDSNAFAKQQSKAIKQIVQKIDYGDTQLSDFLSFFNNVMQIQDLKSFLQACQNICIIKRKKVIPEEKQEKFKPSANDFLKKVNEIIDQEIEEKKQEEAKQKSSKKKTLGKKSKGNLEKPKKEEVKKEEEKLEEKLFICLNNASLKEMLNNILSLEVPDLNDPKKEQANQNTKHQMQKFQQEIVFNLLDKIIDQIRDQQMVMLSLCKNPQNPTQQGIKLALQKDQQLEVTFPDGMKANKYLFDCICLISHLTYIITHTPNLVSALLKHKEGKTFKFLVRNIYFLLALKAIQHDKGEQDKDKKEITISLLFNDDQLDKKCKETIVEFFKRVLLDNPHQTVLDRKLKAEARQIFIKESLKNLCDTNPSKYPQWPILRVVFNVGAVWIMSGILNEEEMQANQDKKVEALVQSTLKFRNILRTNMTKQLIFEAQQLIKQESTYHSSFNLLKQLERIQKELQLHPEFFTTIKESIEHCMNCVLCFLKPFENNQALWGEKSILKPGDISESGLGFMFPREGEDQSIIDEIDEDEDEGDEESHSSSDDEEDDDELLQSERMGEDFGFGNIEDIDYGSELEDDEDDDQEGNGSSDSQGDDSSDGEDDAHRRRAESDPIINDDIELIGDLDDYGEESYGDEEGEYMDYMQDGMERAHKDDQPMSNENERPGQDDSHLDDEEDEEDEEDKEGEDNEEEDEEDEDDSDDMEANYSDDYFDESESALGGGEDQANDPPLQVQIMMGMGRQQLDGESVNNAGNGGRQRRGADMASLNNISMDMFNMNMGGDGEESKGSYSDDEHTPVSHRHTHMLQAAAANGDTQQINQITGILGNIINMMRQAPQYFSQNNLDQRINESLEAIDKKRGIHEHPNLQDLVHTPGLLLKDIFNVNKKMQQSEDLFKLYIKEQPAAQAPGLSPQVPQQEKPSQQKESKRDHEIENSTKSQFSTRNPFDNNQFQQRGTSLFPPQQNEVVQIETSSQQVRQDLNNLDGLDPEFLENLGMEGLQNIIDTDNVINNIVGQGTTPSITNIAQLVENCTNREQRNSLFMSMDESLLNTLPPQLYSEALIVRRLQNQPATNRILDSIRAQVGGIAAGDARQMNGQVFTIFRRGSQHQSSGRNRSGSNQHGEGRPGEMGRNRFMSFDSQINGLGDFSRNFNDPFFRNNRTQTNAPNQANIFRQNTLFSNVVQFMKDELTEMTNSPFIDPQRSLDLDKFCVQLLQQAFSSEPDPSNQSSLLDPSQLPLNYSKVQGLVDMASLWHKCGFHQEPSSEQRFDRLMKIMIRIQGVRYGVMVDMVRWMKQTMNDFYTYVKQNLEDKENKFDVKSSKKVYMGKFLFNKYEYFMLISFVLLFIRSIKSMESFINQTNLQGSLDILKPPSSNASLNAVFQAITTAGSDQNLMVQTQVSLFQYIIDELIVFCSILDNHPEYVIDNQLLTIKDEQSKSKFYEDFYSYLSSIIKCICHGIASKSKLEQDKFDGPVFDKSLLTKLGDLLIFERESIPKKAMKYVKNIFSQLSQANQSQRQLVLDYFRSHLSSYLSQFILILRPDNHSQKLSEIQKVAGQIIQLLKISKEESKIGGEEANICDQEFYFQLMDSVSQLIEEKSVGLGRSSSIGVISSNQLMPINTMSVTSATSINSNNLAFIFKEEFRTIMMVLFVLIEYNLKFIFNQHDPYDQQQTQKQSKKKQTDKSGSANQSKKNDKKKEIEEEKDKTIEFQSTEEMQLEVLQGNKKSKSSRLDLMEAIEQHLKTHISDEKIREDKRLKQLIKFCLEHKKVINSFIRANQQVLNESLRNVVIQVPQMLDFDNKRLLFRSEVKKMKRKYRLHYIQLNVRRDQVFADSFEQMRHLSLDKWRGKMSVEFSEEQGIDEGGLTKEWFILLSKGIFNPDLGLFTQSSTGAGSSYYPNTNSGAIHGIDHIDYFTFIGKIVGKALIEQQLLDAYFVRAMYKIILGQKLTYHDVEDFDNELYKNLKWCLENSTNGIGLTFTETHQYFDVNTDIELIPGGKDIEVTDENKFEYVQKKAYYKLYQQIQKQADAFLKGFYGIVPKDLVQIFDSKELELLISGLPTIDIEDLRENTEYQNYTSQSQIVKWLWEVLEEFDNSERAEFIQFVTGSSKVPVEGFKGLRGARGIQKFQIVKVFSNDTNRLPQAHTCFKQLELPNYTSKEMLKERLLMAITEGKTFGFA